MSAAGGPSKSSRVEFGALTTAAIVAAAIVFVLLNYLSARHFKRWDWTSEGLYTLSDKTKQVLDDIAAKGKTVEVTALVSPTNPLYEDVRELLNNYQSACPALHVEFYDPALEPARTQALLAKFGIRFEEELRTVIFESGSNSKQVDITEFVEYDYASPNHGGPPRIKAFKGEQAFTGAILSVTQDKQTAICFMAGHEEAGDEDAGPSGLSQLTTILKNENYRMERWDSITDPRMPGDCGALVIAGPRQTLLQSEVDEVGRYLAGGGRLLALLDPEISREGTVAPTGLETLLAHYGVDLGSDLVVDRRDPAIILLGAGIETLVLRDLPAHAVTRNLGGTAVMLPIVRSVTRGTVPDGFFVSPLVRTSAEGWAERDLKTLATGIDKGPNDLEGPVTVALAVEQREPPKDESASGASESGSQASDAEGEEASESGATGEEGAATSQESGEGGKTEAPKKPLTRLVVFGDSDFARNSDIGRLGNLDLALNAVHWLAEQETLIGIEPRTPEQVQLTLDPSQARNLVLLVLLGLPGAAALAGLTVWWKRRS